jgi:hypothetical protein
VLFCLAFTLALAGFQQATCQPGQVVEVARGRDYTVNICGIGVVALRGVEPPLFVANGFFSPGPNLPGAERNLVSSGDVLGNKDLGPQAVEFLRGVFAGKRVTIIEDGWRMGDPPGRRYLYAFLPDKTLINAQLIKRGFGYADRQGSHPRRDEFLALESTARREGVGVWGKGTP